MRKIATIFFLVLCTGANSQVGYEEYYSEKDLLSNLQKAKSAAEQIDAAGVLAVNYKRSFKDSLASFYLTQASTVAQNSKDPKLIARAIWWDNRYESDTLKSIKLLQFARQNNLTEEKIVAYMDLSNYYIHANLSFAEKRALDAKSVLENWKIDSIAKDSLKLEIYNRLVHTYVHKKDGINTSRYLLPLFDYARQNRNESLQILAISIIAQMYGEWEGQQKKSTEWLTRSYEYYNKKDKRNELIAVSWVLGGRHFQDGNKIQAARYFAAAEKLMDSLNVYGQFQIYIAGFKLAAKLITLEDYIRLLDTDFDGHLHLPEDEKIFEKANTYLNYENKIDSFNHYFLKYKAMKGDSLARKSEGYLGLLLSYHRKNKHYDDLIKVANELLVAGIKESDNMKQLRAYNNLYDAYKGKKNYKEANSYFIKLYNLENTIEDLLGKDEVASMEMQKQMELQEVISNEQKKAQEAEQSKIAFRNRVKLISLLLGILVLITIAAILWRNNQRKQKDKLKIEQAYNELKSTQSQLIQSEKMASLGELTAGIAHEIQNPLNFVNNFSDVNKELVDELQQELKAGKINDAIAISNDIKDNEEKINHHGKRADAIVKGMLQHSRSSTGQKELTDINALCDEYLRLAYHGLRAKDKSFTADIKTDFDNNIGKVNIIPQDIGRVILNLINNAFYAVDEKKKKTNSGYEPTVSVSTKKNNGKVEISVKDNGNGIPQKVLDKIFQPFFTTKPTGQGTGLGLSLSFDIVKAHGGEIKVETKEGKGTDFIIYLPIS